jgi:hypothetical protein
LTIHFPDFKPIELDDRKIFEPVFSHYQPQTTEWTFTNFFIWRNHYHFQWTRYGELLMFLCNPPDQEPYFLMPMGPPPRIAAARSMLEWLAREGKASAPSIQKADARFAEEARADGSLLIEPQRDHFDYVYASSDLIALAGRRFHSKKNFLNRFEKQHPQMQYLPLAEDLIPECIRVLDRWCLNRDCGQNPVLQAEYDAVRQAFIHYHSLDLTGGTILLEGQVEAFTLGGRLNAETAVIHIEKADPDISGLFAVINQRFVREQWSSVPWINREQDLGEENLRKAKLSYQPARFAEKSKILAR